MKSLRTISDNFIALLDHENQNEHIIDYLDQMELEFNDKAVNINHVLMDMEGSRTLLKAEIERLSKKVKLIDNRDNELKEYLRSNMERTKINKIESPLFNITLGKPSKKLVIDDLELIPIEFKDISVVYKAKNSELLAALKDGQEIPGCHLEDAKSKLIIK